MPPQVFHSICPPKKALSKCPLEEKSLHWKKLRMNMQCGGENCDDVNHSVVSIAMKQLKNAFQQKRRNVESFLTWTQSIGSRWMVNPFQPIWVWARLDWRAHYFCIFICPCLCVCPAGRFNPSQPIWVWARLDWRRQVGETQDCPPQLRETRAHVDAPGRIRRRLWSHQRQIHIYKVFS